MTVKVRFAPSPDGQAARRQRPHRAGQLDVRPRAGRRLRAAHRRHRPGALDAGVRAGDRGRPDLAGPGLGRALQPVEALRPLPRRPRRAEGRGPALSRLRDRRRTGSPPQGAAVARPAADLRPRRAGADRRREAPRFEAEGRKPHWRFKLDGKRRRLGRPGPRRRRGRHRLDVRPGADPRGRRCSSTPCRRWSTTSTWASPTSSAARTTSPTPACRSRSSRRSARPRPAFAHYAAAGRAPTGEALSKRLGSLSIASCASRATSRSPSLSHLGRTRHVRSARGRRLDRGARSQASPSTRWAARRRATTRRTWTG